MYLAEILGIIIRSIGVSGSATILATSWSIPLAIIILNSSESKWSKMVQDLFNSMVSIPTVILGLLLYLLLSKSGPLGFIGLLYTPYAISVGESILITPLIISVLITSLSKLKDKVWETVLALGASEFQASLMLLRESSLQLVRSVLIGFNRAIGELGVALMVGGNIRGFTRVMTTAIALEVSRGNFETALILGVSLLAISTTLTIIVRFLGVER